MNSASRDKKHNLIKPFETHSWTIIRELGDERMSSVQFAQDSAQARIFLMKEGAILVSVTVC